MRPAVQVAAATTVAGGLGASNGAGVDMGGRSPDSPSTPFMKK